MRSFATRLLSARLTRCFLAALAYGCFSAADARAGCGEHVVVMSSLSPEERSFFIRVLTRGGCQSLGQGSGHAGSAAAPRCASCPLNPLSDGPCRGPYCSDERPHEGAPVSPAPTRGLDPWSLLVQIIKLQELTCAGNVEPADAPPPISRTDSIFHPPRAA
jgi:hypothetical protein